MKANTFLIIIGMIACMFGTFSYTDARPITRSMVTAGKAKLFVPINIQQITKVVNVVKVAKLVKAVKNTKIHQTPQTPQIPQFKRINTPAYFNSPLPNTKMPSHNLAPIQMPPHNLASIQMPPPGHQVYYHTNDYIIALTPTIMPMNQGAKVLRSIQDARTIGDVHIPIGYDGPVLQVQHTGHTEFVAPWIRIPRTEI